MKLRWLIAVAVLVLGAFAIWLRMAPVSVDAYHRVAGVAHEAGDWPDAGGFEAVRQVPAPQAALAELARVAAASPGTVLLEGSVTEGLLTYVTRTPIWGAPDVTNLWIEGDRVHLRGHATYVALGMGDETERAQARVRDWLDRAGLN